MMKCRMKGNFKMSRKEIKEILYEPTLQLVKKLEDNIDLLSMEEQLLLAKLKFSLTIFEIQNGVEKL